MTMLVRVLRFSGDGALASAEPLDNGEVFVPEDEFDFPVFPDYVETVGRFALYGFGDGFKVILLDDQEPPLRQRQRDDGLGLDTKHARLNVTSDTPNQPSSFQATRAPRLKGTTYS